MTSKWALKGLGLGTVAGLWALVEVHAQVFWAVVIFAVTWWAVYRIQRWIWLTHCSSTMALG
jgi:predicted PurR-regulated permease PerM